MAVPTLSCVEPVARESSSIRNRAPLVLSDVEGRAAPPGRFGPRPCLLKLAANQVDCVAYRGDGVALVVSDLDAELVLKRQHDVDQPRRIDFEVIQDAGFGSKRGKCR